MGSPASRSPEFDPAIRGHFDVQRNWLLNVLPPARSVCPVCRGTRDPGYGLCFQCNQNHRRSSGVLADAVVPISYSPDNGQHYHQLKVYKSPSSPSSLALLRLAVLYTIFQNSHHRCLQRVAGGPFSHVATVPSTRDRTGVHPLQQIITAGHGSANIVFATANPAHGNAREFHADRFVVPTFPSAEVPVRVLVLEDLWVTGARAQSMAHALKRAGAASVVVVALGRHVNLAYQGSQALLDTARPSGV